MSEAQDVYKANVGNTHEAAVEAVYSAGFNAGVVSAVAVAPVQPDPVVVKPR